MSYRNLLYYLVGFTIGIIWYVVLSLPITVASMHFSDTFMTFDTFSCFSLCLSSLIVAWILKRKCFKWTRKNLWYGSITVAVITAFIYGILAVVIGMILDLWNGIKSYPIYGDVWMIINPTTWLEILSIGFIGLFISILSFYVTIPVGYVVTLLLRFIDPPPLSDSDLPPRVTTSLSREGM